MRISLIAAASENNVIGRDCGLPWSLPDDLRYFKEKTLGHPVITGRKNYASIGRPLPGRTNIIVTRDAHFSAEGCRVVHSLEDAVEVAKQEDPEEIFVMGGGEIYALALPMADRVYLTRVHAEIDGDTYFPELDSEQWAEVSTEEHVADDRHAYDFTILVYDRIA